MPCRLVHDESSFVDFLSMTTKPLGMASGKLVVPSC